MDTKIKLDKPFKTYDQMLDLLESRNVIIQNREFAKNCLSDISYYSLINGYKGIFTYEKDKFLEPIRFEDLYVLHEIDNNLKHMLFKYIINIEQSLKSKLSYCISENYGVESDMNDLSLSNTSDYFCKNNYRGSKKRNNILINIKKKVLERSDTPTVAHYLLNHNHFPCWIAINVIPFGLTIKLYQILLPKDKDTICERIVFTNKLNTDEKKDFLINALEILRRYRNNIAHGQKTFLNIIEEKIPQKIVIKLCENSVTIDEYNRGIGNNDLFAVILIIFLLTRDITRQTFYNEIISFFSDLNNYSIANKNIIEVMKLPPDFIEKIEILMKECNEQIWGNE